MKTISFGVIGGLSLYILSIVEYVVYYAYVLSGVDSALLYICFLFGALVAIAAVIYKNKSPKTAAARFAIMLASYVICVIVGGAFRFLPSLKNMLNLRVSTYAENISGVVQLTFLVVIIAVSFITVIAIAIKSIIDKR